MSFTAVELSSKIKAAQLEDLKKANKTIARLLAMPSRLLYRGIVGKMKIVTYSDASFQNLADQISSGGEDIVFLTNEEEQETALLAWSSNKLKRVIGSTLAAEALSLQEAVSHALQFNPIGSDKSRAGSVK